MQLLRASAAIVLVAFSLAACGGDDGGSSSAAESSVPASAPAAAAPAPLSGSSWQLQELAGAPAQPGALLAFDGEAVNGSTGCNAFAGTYAQDGASLTITLGPMTLAACAAPVDAQERALLDALPRTASFTSDAGGLSLLDAAGAVLARYAPLDASALVGPTWKVTGINDGKEAVVGVLDGSSLTATFAADGSLAGSAGCNGYSTAYTLDGSTLAVEPAASTKKFCDAPPGVMEQEAAFLAALGRATVVEPSPQGFTLRDAAGATQLTLAG